MSRARVRLWGRTIGAVAWDGERDLGVFEFARDFLGSKIELAPLTMPLRSGVFDFPALPRASFHGLPGLLSDSLPDKFGNALIDRWLSEQGRTGESFNPVERLCYTGKRGMGALEFEPAGGPVREEGGPVDIAPLVELASRVLNMRESLAGVISGKNDSEALAELLRVGTSAGGARAKAVLAWNESTGAFHSGQVTAGPGFSQWLVKFDGVDGNSDKELADPQGFGRLEYACYLLARQAGVAMSRSRLHEEGGRAHFMTERFDRTNEGGKLHMLSLGAMRHFDFNQPRAHSYEQALETIRRLELGREALIEQVRRAILNIVICNQDDHVKNIAYLMEPSGAWRLAPAFDVVFAYNSGGFWTSQHQMSLSGKTERFELDDIIAFGRMADLKPRETRDILARTVAAAQSWPRFADAAGVPEALSQRASRCFRLFED